jgi:hypothetical protein
LTTLVVLFAAGGFFAPAPPEIFGVLEPAGSVLTTVGLPVILSMINFVPTPSAAPVTAFTTLLAVEFVLVVVGLTVGFTTDVGLVVLVAGVVDVLVVTVGLVVVVGLVVEDVKDVLGAKVVLGTEVVLVVSVGLVVAGLENAEVNGRLVAPVELTAPEPPAPPADVSDDTPLFEIKGESSTPRITLSNGARSIPLALGSCLFDVRFFRIAMSYPVFFTKEVKPAMLVTGLNFAVLANVLGGATGVAF